MAISLIRNCDCSSVAVLSPTYDGQVPNRATGVLSVDSGITITPGCWVKQDASTGKWSKINAGDTLTTASIIGVVEELKDYSNGAIYAEANVTSTEFNHAIIWVSGGGNILCAETKLYDTSAWVAFVPATHTSLAGQLTIFYYTSPDGTNSRSAFSFS